MGERRPLAFSSLDDVMPDVERLLAGHVAVGRWSLGQICRHLTSTFQWLAEGGPDSASPPVPEAARQKVFRSGSFREGLPVPHPSLEPPPGLDDRTEADALRDAISRFTAAADLPPAHPILGPLTRDEWARFHCIHCAHHLSFVRPA
jgi:hypothetical protein